jgi:hypothetical protein
MRLPSRGLVRQTAACRRPRLFDPSVNVFGCFLQDVRCFGVPLSGTLERVFPFDPSRYDDTPPEGIADAMDQLHAVQEVARFQLLQVIAAFVRTEGFRIDGVADAVTWITVRLGVSRQDARDHLRVAEALAELPHLAEVASTGQLSWEVTCALTEFATATTDAQLAEQARGMTAAHARRLARRHRVATKQQDREARRTRSLTWHTDSANNMVVFNGRLPLVDGETVTTALDRIIETYGPDPVTKVYEPHAARAADALVDLARQRLADDADTDRATVVVHAPAEIFANRDDVSGHLSTGEPVYAGAVRRLACDARLQISLYDENGPVPFIGIGNTSRVTPMWLRRRVLARDHHCRFPGCSSRFGLDVHHLIWVEHGGPTNESNLLALCRHHHHDLHEGGYTARGDANGVVTVFTPTGKVLASTHAGLAADLRTRLEPVLNCAGLYPSPVTHPDHGVDENGELIDLDARRKARFRALLEAAPARGKVTVAARDGIRARTGTDPPDRT